MRRKGIIYNKNIAIKAQRGAVIAPVSTLPAAKVQLPEVQQQQDPQIVNRKIFSNKDAFYDKIYQDRLQGLAGKMAAYNNRIATSNSSRVVDRSTRGVQNVQKQAKSYNTGVLRGGNTYEIAKYMNEHPELSAEGFNKAMQRRATTADAVGGYASSRDLDSRDSQYSDLYDMYKNTRAENMELGVTANDYKKSNAGADWFSHYGEYRNFDFNSPSTVRPANDAYFMRAGQTNKDAESYRAKANAAIERTRGKAIQNNYSKDYHDRISKMDSTTQRVLANRGKLRNGKWEE